MIRLRRPSRDEINAQLTVPDPQFSYREVGATAEPVSLDATAASYDLDRNRFSLGAGRELFERAGSALLAWGHFDIPWLEVHGANAQANTGQVVATLTRAAGLWFLNPCRVVYTALAVDASNEAAFAYGTLSGHVESGEERFGVHFNPITEEVIYEVLAFSRPAVFLTKLGRPWVRRLQERFVTSSAEALARACRRTPASPPFVKRSPDASLLGQHS